MKRKAVERMRASHQSSRLDDPAWAWKPFEPTAARPWDCASVAHLHRRAGFAAPWTVLERDLRDGPAASIDRLLKGEAQERRRYAGRRAGIDPRCDDRPARAVR